MTIDWINILITPGVGAAVGFGVWYFQSRIDSLRRAQESLHDERRKVYAQVLDPFVRIFAGITNPQETKKAMKHVGSYDYRRTAFEFSLVGSDNVVRAFNDLMQYIYRAGTDDGTDMDPRQLMRHWGAFLLEIRRNLGNADTKLTEVDMLKGFITDVDRLLSNKTDQQGG